MRTAHCGLALQIGHNDDLDAVLQRMDHNVFVLKLSKLCTELSRIPRMLTPVPELTFFTTSSMTAIMNTVS